MEKSGIEVRPVSGALGAEIFGVDLSRDLDNEVFATVHQALLDHLVIFFRDQKLTPDDHLRYARRYGPLHRHPFIEPLDGYPDIIKIEKKPGDRKNFGGVWHSDQMFTPQPAMGTMLYAHIVPDAGGDTLFQNMYLAYETLSDGMKRMLSGVRTVNAGDRFKYNDGRTRADVYKERGVSMQVKDPGEAQTTSEHPLIRTHPETGRKALYIGNHTQRFAGMTEAESEPLIAVLKAHSARPEFTCRFRWKPGSLAFWDNRCTQHFAIDDYHDKHRMMQRITICGDTPF